ncbi:MAG: CHAD domain-containing protein, partial [Anaerolineales bacterium]
MTRATPTGLAHARHVADLALALFNHTRPLHRLPLRLRPTLETAALLHHAALEETDWRGHTALQRRLITAIVHIHPKPFGLEARKLLAALSPTQRRQSLALAALLRLAEDLGDSHTQSTRLEGVVLMPEAVRLRLSGPEAVHDAARLRKKTGLWKKAFHARLEIVPAPHPSSTPEQPAGLPFNPQTPMCEVVRRALAQQLHEWQANEAAALAGEPQAVQAVHRAISRLRSALWLFNSYLSSKPAKRLRRRLKEAERRLDRVLEIEGVLADGKMYRAEHARAGLRPLLAAWEEQRVSALEEAKAWLGSPAAEAQSALAKLMSALPEADQARFAQQPCRQGAALVLRAALEGVRERQASVQRDQPKTYQRLGRAIARCAHALEFFRPVLSSAAEPVIEDLTRFQDGLAGMRAARLLQKRLEAFLDEWAKRQGKRKAPQLAGAEGILTYSLARKDEAPLRLRALNQA